MKDYYATLGVTPQAEDIVIKAAYRALAQRYHPDRFAGSANEANRKMAEINEAYGVLSDPLKRNAYDAEYQQAGGNEGDFEAGDQAADEGVQQLNQDWVVALEYYPDLVTLEAMLAKTSKSLAFTFRLFMITEKQFKNRRQVAEALHSAFLANYFGDQPAIIDFAKTLIGIGRKDAAKALNEAVRVLGNDLDPLTVIHKIKGKFGLFEQHPRPDPKEAEPPPPPRKVRVARDLWSLATRTAATTDDVRRLIESINGQFRIAGGRFEIVWGGSISSLKNRDEVLSWFKDFVMPHLEPV